MQPQDQIARIALARCDQPTIPVFFLIAPTVNSKDSRIELVAAEPGVWQLSGTADRDSVDVFFRQSFRRFIADNTNAVTIRIDDLAIADSTILALLVHWRVNTAPETRFVLNNPTLLNLVKVHRIEELFAC